MGINMKCPKCGSDMVQMTYETKHHGCLWTILFGFIYVLYIFIKWLVGFLVFICLDWWLAIIKKIRGKGYAWKCRRWFTGRRRTYYCHSCGYNFRT